MFDLFNLIPADEKAAIHNYISEWAVEIENYVGDNEYFKYYNKNKPKLYRLLGQKFIHKIPFTYVKPELFLNEELKNFFYNSSFYELMKTVKKNRPESVPNEEFLEMYEDLFDWINIRDNRVHVPIKYVWKEKKTKPATLQIQKGMKIMKAIQTFIRYFEIEEVYDLFEEVRLAHSLILNDKEITGTLCFSIHPLDFMTMSDNDSGWSSCMSWKEPGCYSAGTIEMMNSNNVICCYLENEKKSFNFSTDWCGKLLHEGEEGYNWNNKKWRSLVYITKDIIVTGKQYPYQIDDFAAAILNEVRRLAKENLGWRYSFGPELYQDMKHINTYGKMEQNRNWIFNGDTTKHNIIFDTKLMYNDMFNDSKTKYWCVRNKVKKNKIISYSGKAPCICCGDSMVMQNDEDFYEHDYGSYNHRFEITGGTLCNYCKDDRRCNSCDETIYGKKISFNDKQYCYRCYRTNIVVCPCCGQLFNRRWECEKVVARLDSEIYSTDICELDYARSWSDIDNFIKNNEYPDFCKLLYLYMCNNCLHEKISEGIIEKRVFEKNTNSEDKWYNNPVEKWATTGIFNYDDEFIKKCSYKELKSATDVIN